MRDGCVGTIFESSRKDKVCNYGCGLLYKMDRGQTASQNDKEGGKKSLYGTTLSAERANRSLMEGIKTRLGRERKGWVDDLPNVLWAHQTSLKTSNEVIPYSLTFGSEAVIPAEIGMPTHQTMMIKDGSGNEEEMWLNLDLLTDWREAAAIREAWYKGKVEQCYNKRVRPMSFKVGEHVYQKNEASRVENLGKLGPKWEGLYLIEKAYQNGSYKLRTMDDREVAPYVRGKAIFQLYNMKRR
nr:reverse transcriptase domain-containing protein [Tanacetum cinerariifolium]